MNGTGFPSHPITGVPSKLLRSGVNPVSGPVTRLKKSRLTSAAFAQNARSSTGPHRAHNS